MCAHPSLAEKKQDEDATHEGCERKSNGPEANLEAVVVSECRDRITSRKCFTRSCEPSPNVHAVCKTAPTRSRIFLTPWSKLTRRAARLATVALPPRAVHRGTRSERCRDRPHS